VTISKGFLVNCIVIISSYILRNMTAFLTTDGSCLVEIESVKRSASKSMRCGFIHRCTRQLVRKADVEKTNCRRRQTTDCSPLAERMIGLPVLRQEGFAVDELFTATLSSFSRQRLPADSLTNHRLPQYLKRDILARHYPRESEGLCFYRRWFVCLSVCLFVTTITK